MNERIKELAEQSGCKVMDGEWYIPSATGLEKIVYTKGIGLEKFAELIIKECYEHCKGQMLPKGMAEDHGYNYNDGVMDCAIGLLLHFGVEE